VALVRIVVVEDHEQFRRFIYSTLEKAPELQVVDIASDGLAAVQKAEELQPDLILLDIGLPKLNGIEAARRIRKLSPESKILFVSQESSADIVREALGAGASGYIVKTDAGRELLEAVIAVLRGELFVGARFSGHDFVRDSNVVASQEFRTESAVAPLQRSTEIARSHEVVFYSADAGQLTDLTRFIGAALETENPAVVVATKSHR
jgi:DNA-binding NarL/FixJ family response regulator